MMTGGWGGAPARKAEVPGLGAAGGWQTAAGSRSSRRNPLGPGTALPMLCQGLGALLRGSEDTWRHSRAVISEFFSGPPRLAVPGREPRANFER